MATINGTEFANTLNGTAYADAIKGLGGSDKIYGKGGDDSIWGGLGNDSIYGDAGNDAIYGNEGDDVILGGLGNDNLYGDAGTDTVRGEGGNDIIKGGAGKAFLYGGDGNDSVFYDPTTSNISKVGTYLSASLLKGEAGTDTLNLYNNAKVTVGGVEKASMTDVSRGENGVYHVRFTEKNADYDSPSVDVGTVSGFETLKFYGSGGVRFSNADEMSRAGSNVVGTSVADEFRDGNGDDIFNGGAGNDIFYVGSGNDKIISTMTDSDTLYFSDWAWEESGATFQGFNGIGQHGGDVINFNEHSFSGDGPKVSEANGNTIFTMESGYSLTILGATGLIEGVDWFV